jgi:hypothetical protein
MPAFELLYLDVDDEITSAAARIRAAETGRLALVLPYGSRLATSRINFRLLAREADARGRSLEIVTPDPAARALAAAAGLPVHAAVSAFEAAAGSTDAPSPVARSGSGSVGAAEAPTIVMPSPPRLPTSGGSPPGGRSPGSPARVEPVGPRSGRGRRRLAVVLVSLALLTAAGGGTAYILLPSVEVTLRPAVETLGPVELAVTAQEGITAPDPAALLIPALRYEVAIDFSAGFPASGVRLEETAANGSVTFQNCDTGRKVTIPGGSAVETSDGIEFQTLAAVTINRAGVFPFTCRTGSVGVAAVLGGPEGNVAAGRITRIPSGFDPVVLSVTNPAATEGGTRTEFPVVQQADVDAAVAALEGQLGEALRSRVLGGVDRPAGVAWFVETLTMGDTVLSADPATLVGTEVAEFQLGASVSGTVLGVVTEQVATLAEARLRGRLEAGWTLDEESIAVEVGQPVVTGRTIAFPAAAEATIVRAVDVDEIRRRISGLALPEARTILAGYGSAALVAWPDWVTTVPTLDSRVAITVVAGPSATPTP